MPGIHSKRSQYGNIEKDQDSQVVELQIQAGWGYALDLFTQGKRIPQIQIGYSADRNAVGQQEASVFGSGDIWLKIKLWVRLSMRP